MNALVEFFETIPSSYRTVLILAGLTVFLILEKGIPLYKFKYQKINHSILNLSLTVMTLLINLIGAGIIFRDLIPNAIGPVIVYATLTVPQIMLLEAFLSFLGLGVQAPLSSWGLLIRDGAVSMEEYWWLLIFPSLAFSLTLFSLNFIGDGLRDALDPRSLDS